MSQKSEKLSQAQMAEVALAEASNLLRSIAGNRRADETLKSVFRRLERRLDGWTGSRVRAVWYRDDRVRVRVEEIAQLRALAAKRADTEARDDLLELRQRVARLERLLEQTDSAFHSPTIGALRDLVREQSGNFGGEVD